MTTSTKSSAAIKRLRTKSISSPIASVPRPTRHVGHNEVQPVKLTAYKRSLGVNAYLKLVRNATPLQIVEIERHGVAGTFVTDLSERMKMPASRMYAMLRIPKATAARKSAAGAMIDGRAGQAAIGMVKLLIVAQDLVDNSTAEDAKNFDVVKWLGTWIERPQPSLGGLRPSDLLDTTTGVQIVARLLGAMQSGAYQ